MLEQALSTDRINSRHPRGGAHPEAPRSVAEAHTATLAALDLLADGVAAFAAASDVPALGHALARRMARAASADCTSVWFFDPLAEGTLVLAAAWPTRDAASLDTLSLAEVPHAEEAFLRGGAVRARQTGGPEALGLADRYDAPVWVIPLAAGTRRLGLAYVVASRANGHDEQVSRLLTLLGAQAALAARSLVDALA